MNSVSNSTFSYLDVEYIIECDGGILPKENIASVAWVIRRYTDETIVAEGRAITEYSKSTIEAEYLSMKTALIESKEIGCENIIVKTDYDGFIKHLNPNNNTEISDINSLQNILDEFNAWCVKSVKRDNIKRPHQLASSIDVDIDYTFTI